MKYAHKKGLALLAVLVVSLSVFTAPVGAKWVQENNGKWWYYYDNNPQNYAKNGFKKINGSWFYFDKYGFMQTGWVQDKGKWYYMAQNGKMTTGWAFVDDKFYYLQKDGSMARNQVIGKSYVNEYGVWQDDGLPYEIYSAGIVDFFGLTSADYIGSQSNDDGTMSFLYQAVENDVKIYWKALLKSGLKKKTYKNINGCTVIIFDNDFEGTSLYRWVGTVYDPLTEYFLVQF